MRGVDLFMTGAEADEIEPLVRDHHYSHRMPGDGTHYAFAWRASGGLFGDYGEPLAGIIYNQPVARNFPQDALELARLVRREDFNEQLSSFVSWSLRWLRANTDRPFVLSYADPNAGHYGGIYQACGFVYGGATNRGRNLSGWRKPDGSFIHRRVAYSLFGSSALGVIECERPDWSPEYGAAKHLYLKPLRQTKRVMLRQLGLKEQPYPKRDPSSGRTAPGGASHEHTVGVAPSSDLPTSCRSLQRDREKAA